MPAILSKLVVGTVNNEEIMVLHAKVLEMSAVSFHPLKRVREDSSPPPARSQTVSGLDVGVPTPSEADTTSLADDGSDIDSVSTIPCRNKTKNKRLKADPEAELAACIIRIKASKSNAYETFKDPVINYKVSPPMHYAFECKRYTLSISNLHLSAEPCF
ncbi:hypothetical protein FRC08_009395 [Ceratobasidium sp. 394]|nr:hypothetical protein FRC08_009395 [Ceratobasidium sp. 394]KAG9100226.1 hypothetical protein FS749_015925 [Ceratobasidium sp. UAMH 11750]